MTRLRYTYCTSQISHARPHVVVARRLAAGATPKRVEVLAAIQDKVLRGALEGGREPLGEDGDPRVLRVGLVELILLRGGQRVAALQLLAQRRDLQLVCGGLLHIVLVDRVELLLRNEMALAKALTDRVQRRA